jgi:hypothetical protein
VRGFYVQDTLARQRVEEGFVDQSTVTICTPEACEAQIFPRVRHNACGVATGIVGVTSPSDKVIYDVRGFNKGVEWWARIGERYEISGSHSIEDGGAGQVKVARQDYRQRCL